MPVNREVSSGGATASILDVRRASDYLVSHRFGAVNIPLEELDVRSHELPTAHVPVTIYDDDPSRADSAARKLRAAERAVADVRAGADWLQLGPTAEGPGTDRLWKPHGLLIEALDHARRLWGRLADRSALDIACGSGRDAVHLACAGLKCEAWDVLPDALDRCADLAHRNDATVVCRCRDVEDDPTVPSLQYDLICCFNFLHRPLLQRLADGLRPGGMLVYETFVAPQRELFGKPARPAHVLRPCELADAFNSLRIIVSREGLVSPRRHAASLIAVKL